MKAIKIAVIMILILNVGYALVSWVSSEERPSGSYKQPELLETQQVEAAASEGLDLLALTALVKEIRSGQELERKLNEKDSINNLDLNGDNKVDYINVKEFGDVESKIGYSLTVEPVKGEVQELADITVELNAEKAEIQVIGNENIYGDNAIYNDWTPVEREKSTIQQSGSHGVSMHTSYFYPHTLWVSPWLFGLYPPYYGFYPVIGPRMYSSRLSRYDRSSINSGRNSYQSRSNRSIQNPNKGKTAKSGITRSLKKPTATQKQFQATRAKNVKSGGFGRTSRSTTSRALTSSRSSSTRSSTSRFGTSRTSRSTFGGSSFRSSSSGSRSFSFGK